MILPLAARVQLAQGHAREVPAGDDWLTPAERRVLGALRLEKRRADWRMGRWVAKQALELCSGVAGGSVSILAAPDGAPEAHTEEGAPYVLSISHRLDVALCAVARAPLRLGCDLEHVEPRSERFIVDYFTGEEAAQVLAAPAGDRALLANLCWSAKEAVLKALRVGLRYDTRAIEVALPHDLAAGVAGEWAPLEARMRTGERFPGAWRLQGTLVQTVCADDVFLLSNPCPGRPVQPAVRSPHHPA